VTPRKTITLLGGLLLTLLRAAAPALAVDKVATASGDYASASGATSHWEINAEHTLIWAGQPYIPGGGVFQPRVLATPTSDTAANWAADAADLQTLKKHGIRQLILECGGGTTSSMPITSVPAPTLQKVLDALEQDGFTYGIDLNAMPPTALQAAVVNPAAYRKPNPEIASKAVIRSISGMKSGVYFLASSRDGTILDHGPVVATAGGDATIDVSSQGGDSTVLLVYPTVNFDDSTIEGRHCPDFWSGSDDMRDNLLLYFGQIKLGPGLRFFLDPLRDECGYYGVANAGMVPVSDDYRIQFQTWLGQHYDGRLSVLERSWAVKNEDFPDIATAARSIPLWYQAKGLQQFYDPVKDKLYEADAAQSHAWDDIHQFRADSLQSVMNGVADALKTGIADVPVVYRWSQASTATINNSATGFDGLLIDSLLHGTTLADQAAGFAVSDADHSHRTQWLSALLTPPNATDPAETTTTQGLGSPQLLATDESTLDNIGVRGLYVDALRSQLPSTPSLLDAPPKQLDWLHAVEADMSIEATSLSTERPNILYYPSNLILPGAETQQFADGVWWLPATLDSTALDLGPSLDGYSLPSTSPLGLPTFVIYSATAGVAQTAQFRFPKGPTPTITTPGGVLIKPLYKKGVTSFPVPNEPVLVSNVASLPVPEGAVTAEIAEINRLLALAKQSNAPADTFAQRLYYIQNNPTLPNEGTAGETAEFDQLRILDGELRLFVSPYIWIEAENAPVQNFGSVIESSDASGGAYLWLDTPNPPPSSGYQATYDFHANAPGDYDVWTSIAPVTGDSAANIEASPFTITVDDSAPLTAVPVPAGDTYASLARSGSRVAGEFLWCRMTSVHLQPGDHTVTVTVSDPAKSGRWTLGLDCLCLTTSDFEPNGAHRPQP
jgi:hypothetical protein